MLALPAPPPPRVYIPPMELETSETMTPFGIPMKSEQESETEESHLANGVTKTPDTQTETSTPTVKEHTEPAVQEVPITETEEPVDSVPRTSTPKTGEDDELPYEAKSFDWGKYVLSLFARNFYNFKYAALVLAFIINVMLLFYRVNRIPLAGEEAEDNSDNNATGGGEVEQEFAEVVAMEDDIYFREYMMQILAIAHSVISFSMLIAYYCLKVPLVIFKREKEIARKLEFEGLWVAEQPEDDIKAHWDKLVLSTQSFPESYWDKFVKKKVRARYAEQYDYEAISNLLGMDKSDSIKIGEEQKSGVLPSFLSSVDWQYQIWKWGVIFTDNSFLYIAWYFIFSVLGNRNYFFFAAHLLDVAIAIPALRTILQSVTHNGKQVCYVAFSQSKQHFITWPNVNI
ncbi:RYR2 [Mytilus coruscus]|uniref:RYR2 n=1 Tax=Mytilus coruscus TaxID=42192 RepID=A0A6J8CBW5_MYTCO|nr:RYR2 [Mytilus coruscus]